MKPAAAVLVLSLALPSMAMAAPARVASLDQCADQYVMALAPRTAIVGVSPRADDPDSHLRAQAAGLPRLRPTLESMLAARPDVVVRYWGGEPRLVARLKERGVRVVEIEDATDFDGVRANVRRIAGALGQAAAGEQLVADMDRRLAAVSGRDKGEALYLTAGGFTAGPGSLIDAILRAAGFRSAADPGFAPVSVEQIVLTPPARFVLGFFEQVRADWRGAGRHPLVRRATRQRPSTRVPGAVLGCPAWFAAEAVTRLDRSAGE